MEEIWKDIKGYEGDYQVSSFGRVKSIKRYKEGKILQNKKEKDGYLRNTLFFNNKRKVYFNHRLVAQAFLGLDIESDLVVNHKNHITNDNRVENLEIVNVRENQSYLKRQTSSKYTGVCYHKPSKKWASEIRIDKKRLYLGRFNTEEEAHQAYLKALVKYDITNKYIERIK